MSGRGVIGSSWALSPTALTEIGAGIYYSDREFVACDSASIAFLKRAARANPRRRARICAHPNAAAIQHDMLIVSCRETYVAPHRHPGKSESFLALEGEADLLLFDEAGALTERLRLGPPESGAVFFYRMPEGQFHSLDIFSDELVFVESTRGPFDPRQMENASWAPGPDDVDEGRAYIAGLRGAARGVRAVADTEA